MLRQIYAVIVALIAVRVWLIILGFDTGSVLAQGLTLRMQY